MTGKTQLYDSDKVDQFGIELTEYGETFEQFSKELKTALWQKSRHFVANSLMSYGSDLDDPRALALVIESAFRIAVLFAMNAGYVELTADGQADLSQPLETTSNVLEMFPAHPHEEN